MGNFKSKTYQVQKLEDQNKIKDNAKRKVMHQSSVKIPDRMSKEIRDARVSVATTSQAQNEMNETTETVSKPETEEKYTGLPEQNLQTRVETKPADADTSKSDELLQRAIIDQVVGTHRASEEKDKEKEVILKVQAEAKEAVNPVTEQKSNTSSEKQKIEVKAHVAEENAPCLEKSEQATESSAPVEETKLEKEEPAISESKAHESEESMPICNKNRSINLPDQKETENQATDEATPKDEIPEHKPISKEETKTEVISNLHDITTVSKEEVKEVEVQIENVSNFHDINKEDKNKEENSIKVKDDIIVHHITTEPPNTNEFAEEETKKEPEVNLEPKLAEHKQSEDPQAITTEKNSKEFVYLQSIELPESQSTANQDPIQDEAKDLEILTEHQANQKAIVCTKEEKHELELLSEHQNTPSEDKLITEVCVAKKEDKFCSELLSEHSSIPPESKSLIAKVCEKNDGLELLSEQRSTPSEGKSHAVEDSKVKQHEKDNNLELLIEHPSIPSEEKAHAVDGSEVKQHEKDNNLELLVEHPSISSEEKSHAVAGLGHLDLLLEHPPEEKLQVAEVSARKLELLSEEKPTNLAKEEPNPTTEKEMGVEQLQKSEPKEQIANHIDQPQENQPAAHTQEIHPNLTAIRNIEKEVKEMKVEILHFNGTSQDTEYLTLHEMLIRNIIKLDDIVVENNDEIRNERKRVIKFAQQCLSDLERKVENSKPGESNESDSE